MLWLLSMHGEFDVTELGFFTVVLLALVIVVVVMGDRDKSRMESRFSRDLLNRFMGSGEMGGRFDAEGEGEEDEAVELNLGLSLGGRFGVDKSSANNLMRSSSVATYLPVVRDDEAVAAAAPPPVAYSALTRTASLPVETEEEWRKRKELQTLRRMEAKRRRSEKQRVLRAEREGGGGGSGSGGGRWGEEEKREGEVSLRRRSDKDHFLAASKRFGPPLGMPVFGNVGQGQSSYGSEVEPAAAVTGKGRRQPGSQGSVVESHGGGSSSSEMESRPLQGSSSCGELSPVSIKSLREASSEDVGSPGSKLRENAIASLKISTSSSRTSTVETGNPSRPPQTEVAKNQKKETGKTSLEEMPCVFTKGDGPNGRRVDGILYKYGRGEEVRIMCVCHGTFLSPVEFVKHAGGTDVAHPLKHIVVNPNASPFE